MARFTYKAATESGDVIEGDMEAPDQAAVIARIHALGYVPIRVDEIAPGAVGRRPGRVAFGSRRLSGRDIGMLTRELATLLSAGVPLERALEILADLSDNDRVTQLINRVLDGVRGGSSLSEAMAAQGANFPRFYVSTVQAGEAGGSLELVLARLADFMEKSNALRDSVRSALIYPIILLAMAGLSVIVLLAVVIPQFAPLFEDAGAALPLSTRVLVGLGDGVQQYWWLIALIAAGIVLLVRQQLRHPASRSRWDALLLRLPVLGDLVAKIEMARFSRTLATLIGNGVALLSALSIANEAVGNAAISRAVEELAINVKEGRGFAEPLADAGVFPQLATQLIRVGEESGRLEEMLQKVADIYDREVQVAVDRTLALMVPLLTIALGLLVAGIIMSILTAIMSVYELPF